MEKKFYEAPELEVLDMELEAMLLAGSKDDEWEMDTPPGI